MIARLLAASLLAALPLQLSSGCGGGEPAPEPADTATCPGGSLSCGSSEGKLFCCSAQTPYFCPGGADGACHDTKEAALAGCSAPVACGAEPQPLCLTCVEAASTAGVDPALLCAGSKAPFDALRACLCEACAADCGAACDADTDACLTCQAGAAQSACSAEVTACQADAPAPS